MALAIGTRLGPKGQQLGERELAIGLLVQDDDEDDDLDDDEDDDDEDDGGEDEGEEKDDDYRRGWSD